ncbi:MAG: nucleotidyltransferase domain-containing protein [Methylococcales bacterium]
MESKAGNLSCSHSTARFSNAAIREKARVLDAEFSCAESINRISLIEQLFKHLKHAFCCQLKLAMMRNKYNNIRHVIKQYLPDIQIILVFGSMAQGKEQSHSDLDIAILTGSDLTPQQKKNIIENLAQLTGRPIDLVDLRRAGQPLLSEIITKGVRILGSDENYGRLIFRHLLDQADFLPYRNRILTKRRESWIEKS